jgi:hypothetical protein
MQLRDDLVATYIGLLEHDDANSRRGACRALGVLNVRKKRWCHLQKPHDKILRDQKHFRSLQYFQSSASVKQLAFVASNDAVGAVRDEATRALIRMGRESELDHYESTKI